MNVIIKIYRFFCSSLLIISGIIGSSWAILFASAGYKVRMYDVAPEQVVKALANIEQQLSTLKNDGNLRGTLTIEEQLQHITHCDSLEECLQGVFYIQVSHTEE